MIIQTFGYFWEFGVKSRLYPLVDNFINSHYLSAWQCIRIVRRICMLVTPGSERVNPFSKTGCFPFIFTITSGKHNKGHQISYLSANTAYLFRFQLHLFRLEDRSPQALLSNPQRREIRHFPSLQVHQGHHLPQGGQDPPLSPVQDPWFPRLP